MQLRAGRMALVAFGVLAAASVSMAGGFKYPNIYLVPQSDTVAADTPLQIDVLLGTQSNSATYITGVQVDFGGDITSVSNPLKFVDNPATPTGTGFSADPTFTAALNITNAGSLLDGSRALSGYDLSYSAGDPSLGLPVNSGQVLIGSLWVQASEGGSYTLSANFPNTRILDENGVEMTLGAFTDANFQVSVPEPVLAAAIVPACGLLLRRRQPKCIKSK